MWLSLDFKLKAMRGIVKESWYLPSLLSWQTERWTTVQRCCSSWRWWAGGSWAGPKALAACSGVVCQWAGGDEEPHSGCSAPGLAYSGGSSFCDLHPQSCISNESVFGKAVIGPLERIKMATVYLNLHLWCLRYTEHQQWCGKDADVLL